MNKTTLKTLEDRGWRQIDARGEDLVGIYVFNSRGVHLELYENMRDEFIIHLATPLAGAVLDAEYEAVMSRAFLEAGTVRAILGEANFVTSQAFEK